MINVVILGTSNVNRHPGEIEKMKKQLGIEVNFILTYTWSALRENIKKISSHDRYVLIHVLGNEARRIATQNMTEGAKLQKAMEVTMEVVHFCNAFVKNNPQKKVYFSTLLFREDGECHEFLRKKMNYKIQETLNEVPIYFS